MHPSAVASSTTVEKRNLAHIYDAESTFSSFAHSGSGGVAVQYPTKISSEPTDHNFERRRNNEQGGYQRSVQPVHLDATRERCANLHDPALEIAAQRADSFPRRTARSSPKESSYIII